MRHLKCSWMPREGFAPFRVDASVVDQPSRHVSSVNSTTRHHIRLCAVSLLCQDVPSASAASHCCLLNSAASPASSLLDSNRMPYALSKPNALSETSINVNTFKYKSSFFSDANVSNVRATSSVWRGLLEFSQGCEDVAEH